MRFDNKNVILPEPLVQPVPPNDEIWYTSVDDNIIEKFNSDAIGVNLVSNIYENGKGIAKYDGDVLGWWITDRVGGPLQ